MDLQPAGYVHAEYISLLAATTVALSVGSAAGFSRLIFRCTKTRKLRWDDWLTGAAHAALIAQAAITFDYLKNDWDRIPDLELDPDQRFQLSRFHMAAWTLSTMCARVALIPFLYSICDGRLARVVMLMAIAVTTVTQFLLFIFTFTTCGIDFTSLARNKCAPSTQLDDIMITVVATCVASTLILTIMSAHRLFRTTLATNKRVGGAILLLLAGVALAMEILLITTRFVHSAQLPAMLQARYSDLESGMLLSICALSAFATPRQPARIARVKCPPAHVRSRSYTSTVTSAIRPRQASYPQTASTPGHKALDLDDDPFTAHIGTLYTGTVNFPLSPGMAPDPLPAEPSAQRISYGRRARQPSQIPDLGGLLTRAEVRRWERAVEREREVEAARREEWEAVMGGVARRGGDEIQAEPRTRSTS